MRPSRSRPEFFLDRSLGARALGRALRVAGWDVRTHREVYGERDEQVPRYHRTEIAAIRRFRVQAFALSSGNLRVEEQAERLLRHGDRIAAVCSEPGPFVYAIHAERMVRVFPV